MAAHEVILAPPPTIPGHAAAGGASTVASTAAHTAGGVFRAADDRDVIGGVITYG